MWWFFLIQNAPLPERMIGADPQFFLEQHFKMQTLYPAPLFNEAMKEYIRCFCTPKRSGEPRTLAEWSASLFRL